MAATGHLLIYRFFAWLLFAHGNNNTNSITDAINSHRLRENVNVDPRRRHTRNTSHYLLLQPSIRTSFFSFLPKILYTDACEEHSTLTEGFFANKDGLRDEIRERLEITPIFFCTYSTTVTSLHYSALIRFLCLTRINSRVRHLTTSAIIGELRCLFGASADQSRFTPHLPCLLSFTYCFRIN